MTANRRPWSNRGVALATLVLAGCSAATNRVDDRPWTPRRTCTSRRSSVDGNSTETRVERDRFGRVVRFESNHDELFDESFDGFRRAYANDGTIVETRVEANTDETGRTRIVYRRDAHRRVVRGDGDGSVVHRYDELGRLVESVYGSGGFARRYDWSDPRRVVVRDSHGNEEARIAETLDLDVAGRVVVRELASDEQGVVRRTRFDRDDRGHVRGFVEEEGDHILERETCVLDRLGRASSCAWDYLNDGVVDATTTFEYDAEYGAFPCTSDPLPEAVRDDRP